MERIPGPDFPTGGLHLRPRRHPPGLSHRPRLHHHAGQAPRSRCGRATRSRSSSPRSRTRSTRRASSRRSPSCTARRRIEGIADIRDESDRQRHAHRGRRARRASPRRSCSTTSTSTRQLQDTFGIIMLAIVEQRPRVLNLLEVCELFIDFRREVVRRRTAFELRKAEARAHILEGYVIALDHLDAVIALIRAARHPEEARDRPHRAVRPERDPGQGRSSTCSSSASPTWSAQKIVDELARDPHPHRRPPGHPGQARARRRASCVDELAKIRDDHGDPRRTRDRGRGGRDHGRGHHRRRGRGHLDHATPATSSAPRITTYRSQRRGGRGRMGMKTQATRISSTSSSSPPPTPTS